MLRRLNLDQINIGLMLLSLAAAYTIPFELVLISYAFLGPAHYLTEISWLHDRSYFTGHKWTWIPLCLLGVVITALGFAETDLNYQLFIAFIVALCFSIAMVLAKSFKFRLLILSGAAVVAIAAAQIFPPLIIAVIILLPTVIHIYIFTGLFILGGALKNHNFWGYLSFGVFLFCGAFFLFVTPSITMVSTDFVDRNLGNFDTLVDYIAYIASFGGRFDSHAVLGFLSFAYTYHYLNWFSKTEIIKWHQIPKRRFYVIVSLYLASVSVYLIDFNAGFLLLTFLSLTHVLLEFPLNALSIKMIGTSVRGRWTGRKGATS